MTSTSPSFPGAVSSCVTARIALPPGTKAEFLLNGALKVTKAVPTVEEIPLGDVASFFGNNAAAEEPTRRFCSSATARRARRRS